LKVWTKSRAEGAFRGIMEDIERWIKKQVESGYTPQEVKDSLEESGRNPEIVDEVLGGGKDASSKRSYLYGAAVVVIFLVAITFYFYPRGGVSVTRSIDSPRRPGSTPEIVLNVDGNYRSLVIEEEVPEELDVIAQNAEVDEEENMIKWELEDVENVSYKVVTPGTSTGEYAFSGTYLYGGEERTIQGDSHLEVRW